MSAPEIAEDLLSDVVRIAQALIRIDTSNFGGGRAEPESDAADLVEELLAEVGLQCHRFEAEPGRTNLIARWSGTDPAAPALLLHGHLDVVPADPSTWTVPPFAGVIRDGMLWGRGAIDMKNMVAMIVATVRAMIRNGERPDRDVVLAFFADEEAGCTLGSKWMVANHPEQFTGVGYALGEGGGYSVSIGDRRGYLMNTGEKGLLWIRLRSRGRAGHASLPNDDSAIQALAAAVVRVGALDWPITMTDTTSALLQRLRELTNAPETVPPLVLADAVGLSATRIRAGMQNVANVTIIAGGYKENVVPEAASALIDIRFLPGQRDIVLDRIREAVGPEIELDIEMEMAALESPFEGELVDAVRAAVAEHDSDAVVLPHLIPGGTDGRPLSALGLRAYGFIPLRLQADFNFPGMFHGVDERVPLTALQFGQDVLTSVVRRFGKGSEATR